MIYRNPSLLALAQDAPCMVRLPRCERWAGVVAAHSNRQRHGKGRGIKSHDCFIAFACHACHYEIDQGSTLSREERADAWVRGFEAMLVYLWAGGLVQVTLKRERIAAELKGTPDR